MGKQVQVDSICISNELFVCFQLMWAAQMAWIFLDGSVSGQQNPPTMKFPLAGTLPLKLVVDNGGYVIVVLQVRG
jgi:hypothetical protein